MGIGKITRLVVSSIQVTVTIVSKLVKFKVTRY